MIKVTKFLICTMMILMTFNFGITAYAEMNYRNIPNVTDEEIDSIEKLKQANKKFKYASLLSNEAFVLEDGSIVGFSTEICKLLTQLFEMQFEVVLYEWDDLLEKINENEFDFTGDLTPTAERKWQYIMSAPIAERSTKSFQLSDALSVNEIAKTRTPIFTFMKNTVSEYPVTSTYDKPYEIIYAHTFDEVARLLTNGTADVFFAESSYDIAFDNYPNIVSSELMPPAYSPVSIATHNSEYSSIISVFNKYLENGGVQVLSQLFIEGITASDKHRLSTQLTDEEHAYIDSLKADRKKVKVAAESENYPVSFYNSKEKAFQGISIDILAKITELTGIEFEIVTGKSASFETVFNMLSTGEAQMASGMTSLVNTRYNFLWNNMPYESSNFMLISKKDIPKLHISQIIDSKVGIIKKTASGVLFNEWFPSNHTTLYENINNAFEALDNGEVELIAATGNMLLGRTNFQEQTGYSVNVNFNYPLTSEFCFDKNETILASIISKAQSFSYAKEISDNWNSKMFDYSNELAKQQTYYMLFLIVLLCIILGLLITIIVRGNNSRKILEGKVNERTQNLEKQAYQLTAVYNSIPDLLSTTDDKGFYTSCNPKFCMMVGLPYQEIIGKTDKQIFSSKDGVVLKRYFHTDKTGLQLKETQMYEESITHKDGTKRVYETKNVPLFEDDRFVGTLSISRDITERKVIEKAAQVASKAKSSFLARMSHEIRTPLNAIVGMALISKKNISNTERTLSSIDKIITSSNHLLGIINDVLDMSKIESGKLELYNQGFDLFKALREASSMIVQRCIEKGIKFVASFSEVKGIGVIGDKLRLNQILINLLGNAVKFTDTNGEVKLQVSIVENDETYVHVRFSITDNGIGMTSEQIAKLFVPFEQADSSISAKFGGTGLGLSISLSLVRAMGSKIIVESEHGKGSTFSFTLQLEKTNIQEEEIEDEQPELNLEGKRILLVEDIEINRLVVTSLLEDTGLTIEEAENGRIAVDMFNASPVGYYSMIFMDVQMPVMDGYEASREIRLADRPDAKTVRIVAMTANAYKEDFDDAMAAGMDTHISKPIDIKALKQLLAHE